MEVIYLCDGRACEKFRISDWLPTCPNIECNHTADIRHAVNFEEIAPGKFVEKSRGNYIIVDNDYHDI